MAVYGLATMRNDQKTSRDFVDPAGMLEALLSDSLLVSDESVTWEGRPARLLVVRSFAAMNRPSEEPQRFDLDAKIWLDESGVPRKVKVVATS